MAFHEVGHALVTALQKDAEPVQKITIVPRTMGALGYVMQVPEEEKYLMSQEEMYSRITTCLGGRAAEKLVFNSVTTGASNDIEQATKVARAMVTQYGMSDKFGMIGLESVENRYLDGRPVMNCSDETAAEVDHEVMRIIKECYVKAEKLLADNREVLDKIAEYLIKEETITGKEFMRIFREIKGLPEPEETDKKKQETQTVHLEKEKNADIEHLEETTENKTSETTEDSSSQEEKKELFTQSETDWIKVEDTEQRKDTYK